MRTGRSNNKVWLLMENKYNKQALIDYEKLINEFSFDKLGLDFNKDIIIHEKYKNLVEPCTDTPDFEFDYIITNLPYSLKTEFLKNRW